KKLREKFSNNGIEFAKKFDWEKKIIPKWLKFLSILRILENLLIMVERSWGFRGLDFL
ncbi:unnamed protein product, partial [marine sediment metagenome]